MITHCKHGHEYTPENTYIHPTQGKICRTCKRINAKKWNRRWNQTVRKIKAEAGHWFYIPPANRTHCPEGHEYDMISKQGWRRCSICIRENRRWREGFYDRKPTKRWPQPRTYPE